tara:strand:- start:5803 stop:7551 length:1749 start_codon:yes stop_codon:yes gene_type:complete
MNKSSILKVKQKASKAVTGAETVITRFARFMGTESKGLSGGLPSKSTMKKARKFANTFHGGGSKKLGKMLIGSAIILPMVLGTALKARSQSPTDILNSQYGGDVDKMKDDLGEEQKQLDKSKKTMDDTVEGKAKDIDKDKADISTKKPEQAPEQTPEEPKEEEGEDEGKTRQEINDEKFVQFGKEGVDLDAFQEMTEKFAFIVKRGGLFSNEPGIGEKIVNFLKDTGEKVVNFVKDTAEFINNSQVVNSIRDFVGAEKGDGYLGPKWLGIKNPFANKTEEEVQEEVKGEVLQEDGSTLRQVILTSAKPLQTIAGESVGTASYTLPEEVAKDESFMSGVGDLAEKLNVPTEDLLAVMDFETGGTFDPAQKNMAGSGAVGLIQFMPSTAEGLGTSTEELAAMTRTEQLEYVEKFLEENYTGRMDGKEGNVSDLYMSVLFPAAVGKPDDFVLFGEGAMNDKFVERYEANKGLDLNKDGSITKGEAASKVVDKLNKNTTSEVSASSVETSGEMIQAMTLPNKSMPYDQPGGGGGTNIIAVPPVNNKGDASIASASMGGEMQTGTVLMPADEGAIIATLTLNSLGAS